MLQLCKSDTKHFKNWLVLLLSRCDVESEDVCCLSILLSWLHVSTYCKQVSQKLRSNVHAVGDALICSIVQLMLRLPLMMHRLKRFKFSVHMHTAYLMLLGT